jgi:Uma2 family endonuclease
MATIDRPETVTRDAETFFDPEGYPWLENGEHMDQAKFHARYLNLPPEFKAELIEGVVYVMPSPLKNKHARSDFSLIGWLYVYSASTPGTAGQSNATTILGDKSEPQPDSALLILPAFGGQSRDGDDDITYGAPELIVEIAWSSRSIDLSAKLRDYERAGVREYVVQNLHDQSIHWHFLQDGKFELLTPGSDGIYRSRAFPGLWLDPIRLFAGDNASVIKMLQQGIASPEHAAFVADLERRRSELSGGA